jgi:hypothetical protein
MHSCRGVLLCRPVTKLWLAGCMLWDASFHLLCVNTLCQCITTTMKIL